MSQTGVHSFLLNLANVVAGESRVNAKAKAYVIRQPVRADLPGDPTDERPRAMIDLAATRTPRSFRSRLIRMLAETARWHRHARARRSMCLLRGKVPRAQAGEPSYTCILLRCVNNLQNAQSQRSRDMHAFGPPPQRNSTSSVRETARNRLSGLNNCIC